MIPSGPVNNIYTARDEVPGLSFFRKKPNAERFFLSFNQLKAIFLFIIVHRNQSRYQNFVSKSFCELLFYVPGGGELLLMPG